MIVHSSKNPIVINESKYGIVNYINAIKQYRDSKKEQKPEKPKLTDEERLERDKIGKQIQKYVISNLKKYASSAEFKNKYKNNLTPKSILIEETDECIPSGLGDVATYEIKISNYEYGVDDRDIIKWKRENPGKTEEDCPIWNNDWYYDLLNKGKELVKEANDKFNNKYELKCYIEAKYPVVDIYIYNKL